MSTPMERAKAAMSSGPVLTPRGGDKRPGGALPQETKHMKHFSKTETNLASEGHTSTREENNRINMRYVRILQEGTNGVPGILSRFDMEGEELIPYMHQRQAVKKAAHWKRTFMLMAHDAGTGKTATFFQLFAAMEQCIRGGARCIITVPPATLPQWEQTAHDWLNLTNKNEVIACTNQAKKITTDLLNQVRVLIISRHLLASLYKQCWEYVAEYEKNERGHWVSKWVRKENVPLHPLWKEKWDLLGVDEARNPTTEWCVSHHQLSKGHSVGNGGWEGGCKKRIALTATPVFNKPLDMVGLCKAINASPQLQQKTYWSLDRQCRTINKATVEEFQEHTDRVKDDILSLPQIHQKHTSFRTDLPEDAAIQYNDYLRSAQNLRMQLEQNKVSTKDLQKLMYLLQRMQQLLVSPRLAKIGAKAFKEKPAEIDQAAAVETGALRALREQLVALKKQGHRRVMVAAVHVTLMQIAKKYLQRKNAEDPENSVGSIFIYDGTLSLQQRQAQRASFLNEPQTVLLLSIGAGGTGLHLVPTKRDTPKEGFCCSCVFWGSRPFSPQQVWQALKRIHRIGQQHEVFVHHLIADGSVDYAINCVHSDKEGLADAIVDNNWANCDEVGGEWRRTGRIVDQCCEMLANGNFPKGGVMPIGVKGAQSPAETQSSGSMEPPRHSLVSQFFRQPLHAAAAAAAAAAVTKFAPPARNEPWPAGKPRGVPLPGLATAMPFGRATLRTDGFGDASSLAAEANKLSALGVNLEM